MRLHQPCNIKPARHGSAARTSGRGRYTAFNASAQRDGEYVAQQITPASWACSSLGSVLTVTGAHRSDMRLLTLDTAMDWPIAFHGSECMTGQANHFLLLRPRFQSKLQCVVKLELLACQRLGRKFWRQRRRCVLRPERLSLSRWPGRQHRATRQNQVDEVIVAFISHPANAAQSACAHSNNEFIRFQ